MFAPTDEAFAKLPAGTVENLLKPENKAKLTAILTYHVVPGAVRAEQVTKLDQAKTVNGAMVKVTTKGDKVTINDATVVKADVVASNGIIHVIDKVILPPRADRPPTAGPLCFKADRTYRRGTPKIVEPRMGKTHSNGDPRNSFDRRLRHRLVVLLHEVRPVYRQALNTSCYPSRNRKAR